MKFPQIIVALDQIELVHLPSKLVQLKENFSWIKVGMELFHKGGHNCLDLIKKHGFKIFLDLKLHDIPETVYQTLKIINNYPIDMINVHLSGGLEMCLRSRQAITNPNIKLIGVSVLTSMDNNQYQNIFKSKLNLIESIQHLTEIAINAHFDGIVCSALDLGELNFLNRKLITITPGIRLYQNEAHDQKRISTPKCAIENGAQFLVMGREIIQAKNYPLFIKLLGDHLNE